LVFQQRGIVFLLENIAQAPPYGSIFSFCSENKKLGTGVTTAGMGGFPACYPLKRFYTVVFTIIFCSGTRKS
jgi:hypothetical protein